MNKLPYDETSVRDIFKYSNDLVDNTFEDVLSRVFEGEELYEKINNYNNPRVKGGLGNLIEEHYFFINLIVILFLILIKLVWN